MTKIIILIISCAILVSNCASPLPEKPKTPEQLKFELLMQERDTPLTYLTVKAKMRSDKKLVRAAGIFRDAEYEQDGKTIHGTIKNSATVAKFKDIVLTISFISKTKSIIETKDYVVYEFYNAGSTSNFKIKVYPPDAEDGFYIGVKSATPVD